MTMSGIGKKAHGRSVAGHESFRPLIIVGAPRSGTNILRDVLTRLDGFGTWPCDEINPLWRHGNSAAASDELAEAQATPRVSRYIRGRFAAAAAEFVGPSGILVEKTCATCLRVPFVHRLLPEARFIQLVRDGRGASVSAMFRWTSRADLAYVLRKARFAPALDIPTYALRFMRARVGQWLSGERRLPSWGPRFEGIDEFARTETLLRVCARQWAECVRLSTAALEELPRSKWIRLRYEHFVADPVKELHRVLSWLRTGGNGVWQLASEVKNGSVEQAAAMVRRGGSDGWRQKLPAEEVESARDLLEPFMALLGYEWT